MGIVSVVVFAAFVIALAVLQAKLHRQSEDRSLDPEARGVLKLASWALVLCILVSGILITDAYIYKFPNPFAPPKVENIQTQSAEPPKAVKPDLKAPEDTKKADIDKAREEHGKKLDDWEKK